MTKGLRLIATAVLLGFAVVPIIVVRTGAQQFSARAKQIGSHLKCMCGACDMTASGCSHPGGAFSGPCQAWALPALREIDDLVGQGKTDEQILQAFVQKYGTSVYAVPPKTGFSLVAWLMPTAYLALGTMLVLFVVSRWRKRPAKEASPTPKAISPELLARARELAERETED